MKPTTINLTDQMPDVTDLIGLAQQGPVLLITADGKEFLLSEADNFEQEVETLRASQEFQRFLEARSASKRRFSLEAMETEIDEEMARMRLAK